jgi:hypothetical protein
MSGGQAYFCDMRRSTGSLAGGTVLGLVLLAGVAYGGGDVSPMPGAPAGAPDGGLDVSIRARALGLVPEPLAAPSLEFEPQRAPTGAGSMRWPSDRTEIARGVYVGLMPSCGPEDLLRGAPRRRTQPRR